MTRTPRLAVLIAIFFAVSCLASDDGEPTVHLAPTNSVGPRQLEKQTETSVVRDYLDSWKTLRAALAANNAAALDADFVGIARQKFADTIEDQQKLGIETRYQDRSHDLKLLFYSPEGLSIQLADNVEYDVQILDHGKVQGTQHIRAHYIAVLTPTEVRWKVRILQAAPE